MCWKSVNWAFLPPVLAQNKPNLGPNTLKTKNFKLEYLKNIPVVVFCKYELYPSNMEPKLSTNVFSVTFSKLPAPFMNAQNFALFWPGFEKIIFFPNCQINYLPLSKKSKLKSFFNLNWKQWPYLFFPHFWEFPVNECREG